jgi:hypothetical protein
VALEDNARMFIQRVRANEYSNESQLRFAFQTILPQIIGFGQALDFASGAETFKLSEDERRLFFDTHYGSVIFEFKFSFTGSQIRPTVEQLADYCTQQISQGATNIIAIASDVMNWQTYDVDVVDGKARLSKARNGSLHLGEGDLTDHRIQEFIQYIRRVVSGQQRQWTQNTVLASFGAGSKIYRSSELILKPIIHDVLNDSHLQENLFALSRLLTFQTSGEMSNQLLSNHLYLELFTRTLVLSSLERSIGSVNNRVLLDSAELNARLNSDMVFQEDGFFDWISREPWASRLHPVLEEMKLAISNFETPSCAEVLPYVYDSLNLEEPSNWFGQTRTPVELVRRIINEMFETFEGKSSVLDPFCGTGTFVVEWSKMVFGLTDDIEKTSASVFGIDINPAAVLIARSIWVETFFDEIQKLALPCHVPIYNGDSLFHRNIPHMDTTRIANLRANRVDAVVGNPPWAALSHLPDAPYKDSLHKAAAEFGIREGSSSHHHQNISTPFILVTSKIYLRDTGQFGFILPRDTINGRAHELFRRSAFRKSKAGSKIIFSKILDLNKDIFDTLPATVWFGNKSPMPQEFPIQAAMWPELFFRLEGPHKLTLHSISERPKMSALLYEFEAAPTQNDLQYSFRQGADVLPLPCFAVDVIAEKDGVARVQTSFYATNNSDIKHKSKDMQLTGHVETDLIYRFDSSMHLFPYCWRHDFGTLEPLLAAAPVLSDITDKGITHYRTMTDIELSNFQHYSKLFGRIERIADVDLRERLNVRNKLEYCGIPEGRYMVAHPMTGQNTVAGLIDTLGSKYNYIRHQQLYTVSTDDLDEAYFLLGMLNSSVLNKFIQPFQNTGLFGGRHVHTLPRQFIPKYDSNKLAHKRLSTYSKDLHAEIVLNMPDNIVLELIDLDKKFAGGRVAGERKKVLRAFGKEFIVLDELVEAAISGAGVNMV